MKTNLAQFVKLYVNSIGSGANLTRLYVSVTEENGCEWAWKVEIVETGFKHPKTQYSTIHTLEEIINLSKAWTDDESSPTAEVDLNDKRFIEFEKSKWIIATAAEARSEAVVEKRVPDTSAIRDAADRYISNHPDSEIRRMYGHHFKTFLAGVKYYQRVLGHIPPKGEYNGECYRTVCDTEPAAFYNFSTRQWYCKSCAKLINDANRVDSISLYGHDLCLKITPEDLKK